jgi:hypothetical protein
MKFSAHFLVFTIEFCQPSGLGSAQFSQHNGKDTKFCPFFVSAHLAHQHRWKKSLRPAHT